MLSIKKRYLIIGMALVTIMILSVGYSLYSENLTITATGIIGDTSLVKLNALILTNEDVITTGDGLYSIADPLDTTKTRYYFSGATVNNSIIFNGETWRIISIEADGSVRIIKDSCLSSTELTTSASTTFWSTYSANGSLSSGYVIYDSLGRRPIDTTITNSYCNNTKNGCNAYGQSSYYDEVVDADSLIKLYLDTIYYPSLSDTAKSQMTPFTIKTGLISTSKQTLAEIQASEIEYTISNINVSLANVSDFVLASTDSSCRTSAQASGCANNNWMKLASKKWFLLNGRDYVYPIKVIEQYTSGYLVYSQNANSSASVRPVVQLNANISAEYVDGSYVLGALVN